MSWKFAVIWCIVWAECILSDSRDRGKSKGFVEQSSLRLVTDVYDEEGISIRHMGKLSNVPVIHPDALETVLNAPARGTMNFSEVSEAEKLEDDAFSVTIYGGFVGYEGLIFDRDRAFSPDFAWNDAIIRPEMITFQQSAEKPRLDPISNGTRILVDWDRRWPAMKQDHARSNSSRSGPTWVSRPRIISLLQRSSHAYYHFLCEALPRIFLLSFELEEHPDAEANAPDQTR
jgi:hypothetical protein